MSQLDLTRPMPPAQEQKKSFAELVRSKISTVLVGKKADDFVTSLISLMNQDVALRDCEPMSLIASALQAQSLNLSLNRQLGQAWVVSYRDNKNNRNMATFQLGYKGYVQLAIRSGNYRKLNVIAVKEGELKFFDPLNEELEIDLIQDDALREETPTTGYYAMFEYLNGFRKCLYWSKEKMQAHALRYSKAYKNDLNKGWNNSFWSKDFDAMAFKTMIRQLISKWGVMSVEMQQAMDADMKSIKDIGSFGDVVDTDIVDSDSSDSEVPAQPEAQPAPAVNLITCPKTEKQLSDWTCSDCDQHAQCPAWAE